MKKFLVTALFSIFLITNVSAAFDDVSNGHMYDDAIDFVEDENIVNGYSDGTFRPDNLITRAEFTKIIVNALYDEDEIEDCNDEVFDDVDNDNKFFEYICLAEEKDIVSGYSDDRFRPDEYITLGEASKILAEAYNFLSDRNDLRVYAEELIERRAIPEELRALNEYVTRGQMAEMVYRIEEDITNRDYLRESALYDQIVSLEVDEYDSRNDEIEGRILDRINYSVFKNEYGDRVAFEVDERSADDLIDELEDLDGDEADVLLYINNDEVRYGFIY